MIRASPEVAANLALLRDKALLFSPSGNSFLMYAVAGRTWVAMGDPIGPEPERADLVWRFRELADRHGGSVAFYEVGPEHLPLYLDLGLTLIKLGENARVATASFSLEGGSRKAMRHLCAKLEKEGCEFAVLPPAAVPALLPELMEISDAWLAGKKTREKGFSLGFFDPDYLSHFPLAVVHCQGRILAFANIWAGDSREEYSMDLMRFRPDAGGGLMDYLLIQLLLWGRQQGYVWCNLGMAPLAGLKDRALAPLWPRLAALIYRHGEQFYNFQGLHRYKEKFDPEWQPRYLACAGGLLLPRTLTAVTGLIAGGLRGVVTK